MSELNLQTECFSINDGKVVAGKLEDFERYIDTTTRPTGVGYEYYVTQVERKEEVFNKETDEYEEITVDKWALARWITRESIISVFDTEEEAKKEAEGIYVQDILNNQDEFICLDREQAERVLKEMSEE